MTLTSLAFQVFQEVVLAKEAVLLCGNLQLSWEIFALAIQWARHRIPLWNAECVSSEDFSSLIRINKTIRLKLGKDEMTMEVLLREAFGFQASDPLDKVYGLLGLLARLDQGSDDDPATCDLSLLVPDYQKPLSEVYALATWFAMKQEKSLGLLEEICPRRHQEEGGDSFSKDDGDDDPNWPSWVPKFHLPKSSMSNVGAYSPDANAHNDFEAIISLTPSLPFVLEAHGLLLGTIEKLRITPSEILDTNMYEGHDAVFRYFSYLWDPAFVDSKGVTWSMDFVEMIASALVCGHYSRDPGYPYPDAEQDPATVTDFAAFMLEMKDECSIPDCPQLQNLLEQCHPDEGDTELYARSVKSFAQKLTHLEISNARFGVGYKSCAEGDEVCILFGARHPYVVRQVGEYWRIIGNAYVAGVMKVSQPCCI